MHENEELLVITQQGKILRTPAADIRTIGRATQGVRVMDLDDDDSVVSVALVERDEILEASEPLRRDEIPKQSKLIAMSQPRSPAEARGDRAGARPARLARSACSSRPPEQQFLHPVLPRRAHARQRHRWR